MKKIVIISIIIMYVLLMAGFLYFQFVNVRVADWMKFCTIVLSFLTIAFLWKDSFCRYDGTMVLSAMFIIVIADIISIFHHRSNEVIFVVMYIVIMTILFMRYNYKKWNNALILPLFLIIPITMYFLPLQDWIPLFPESQRTLIVVTFFYIQVLISVIVFASIRVKQGRFPKINAVLIITGLIIFCFGDICVALANLELPREYRSMQIFFNRSIWVFYTPSKALLAFSAFNYSK